MSATFTDPDQPPELLALAYHDPGEPWLQWSCPVQRCSYRVVLPWDLEQHTAAKHPGWVAVWESELERVVFRLAQGDS